MKKRKTIIVASIAAGVILLVSVALLIFLDPRFDINEKIAKPEPAPAEPVPITPEPTPRPTSEPTPPPTPSPESTPEPTPEPAFTPISYRAYGNGYSITGYEIGTDDDGTTTVTLFGTGYDTLPIRDGQARIPVWVDLVSEGTEFSSTSCKIKSDQVMYSFSFEGVPDTIIAINGETDEIIITIEVDGNLYVNQPLPAAMFPIEYIGSWEGSVNDINISLTVEPDGTGTYTFEHSGYTESYDFSLEVDTETFTAQIPENNTLGIAKIEGTYEHSDRLLILDVRTTFSSGGVFTYTVPCRKV